MQIELSIVEAVLGVLTILMLFWTAKLSWKVEAAEWNIHMLQGAGQWIDYSPDETVAGHNQDVAETHAHHE